MHQFGWLSERRGNYLNLLQKEGVFPERGGAVESLRKGRVPTLEETRHYTNPPKCIVDTADIQKTLDVFYIYFFSL